MLMNRAETALITSPPRRWLQRAYEVPVLLRFGGRLSPGSKALEIGCGSGYGSQLVLQRFGAQRIDALDLDPAMIERARVRLGPYGERVNLVCGSATDLRSALNAEDRSYDAVFDFGIIHHIPDWRAAVAEAARVLTPGGRCFDRGCQRRQRGIRSQRVLTAKPPVTLAHEPSTSAELRRYVWQPVDRRG